MTIETLAFPEATIPDVDLHAAEKMLYDVDKVGVHATRVGSRVDYELIALTSDVIKTMY